MEFGLFLEFPALEDVTDQEAFTEGFALVDEAERMGVDSLWLAEYHFSPFSVLSAPVTVATAIAARTKRARIGFGVLLLPLSNPVRIAEEAATLDHISQGRLDFGIGRGTFQTTMTLSTLLIPRAGAALRSTWKSYSRRGPKSSSPSKGNTMSAVT